jgi:nucleotide-binding universal stress UspA family protein
MRYLVATDGSAVSDEAVSYAAKHAAAIDATLVVAHVITPEAEFVDGDLVRPSETALLEEGRQTLERAREHATSTADVTVEMELLSGRPADAVVEYAETAADAIYVGHRGLSEKRERVVGSVAKTVVDRANVPVTVVR